MRRGSRERLRLCLAKPWWRDLGRQELARSLRPRRTQRLGRETASKPPNPREPMRGRLETLNDLGLDQFSDEGANTYEAHFKKRGRSPQPEQLNQDGQSPPRLIAREQPTEDHPRKGLQALRGPSFKTMNPSTLTRSKRSRASGRARYNDCHSAAADALQVTPTGRHDKREKAQWRPHDDLASKRKPSRPRPAACCARGWWSACRGQSPPSTW